MSEQIALPGMDSALVERGRKIGATLRQLIEVVERITGATAEVEAGDGEVAGVINEAKKSGRRNGEDARP